jgi:hypothetical protein
MKGNKGKNRKGASVGIESHSKGVNTATLETPIWKKGIVGE